MPKKILGYIFGYKDTSKNDDNNFTINFFSGISDKDPTKKYGKKKDFYCETIRSGDFTKLFAEEKELNNCFDHEYNKSNCDFYIDLFEQRKKNGFFQYISLEECLLFSAVSYVQSIYSLSNIVVEDSWISTKINDITKYKLFIDEQCVIYQRELDRYSQG